jgi:hypothetical protein
MKRIVPFLLLVTAACGPMSPERAARICEERARAAAGPTGEIGIGITSDGDARGSFEIGITSDYLQGRDPYEVYDSCVRQKTGQGPVRPLDLGR